MEKEKVSPDSSTHIATKRKKSRKKKEKDSYRERKRAKKLKASKHTSVISDSSNNKGGFKKKKGKRKSSKTPVDDDDVKLDIKPLSSYVDDREELHAQLFTIISKKELKGMLPSTLKKLEVKEIKRLCYDQLEILSCKRLQHIIAGEEMVSSSSSSLDGETDEEANGKQNGQSVRCPESQMETRQEMEVESVKQEQGKKPGTEDADLNIFQEMIIAPNQDEIDELVEGNVKPDATNEDALCDSSEEQQSGETWAQEDEPGGEEDADATEEAELKMLEFRARALKSLVLARERQMKQKAAKPK